MKNGKKFKEFMDEKQFFSRWDILRIGIYGAFCGTLLTASFFLMGFA